ncbi:MAG: riboflavin synthase subunit alpha [Gemmatimonadetes bacterium 13_2_20CM_69_27]|nr:MAG: riboflavin synthase subunit alpha [Gemmatimonadetes bacterium 13_2_20CM_69_27]OLB58412.1 MAG: riboflavin synthase subunit alpha [Gemmatimonadetes bacterium 13_2_20CM_2_69_23]OLD59787.1 MAG: riboflavin synthase subunit alpha [Gemmatimonadetes bacterium 13_1_20CM_69_28]PYO32219.1 MAG: riboflavin synthase [Gemmatimonadota bacterium]PYP26559.1 MAG: riboflavin synthase [Gemmatimonadota bacterium]
MFTGIVSAVGTVAKASRETGNGKRETGLTLTIRAPFKGLKKGESIAVNGACLTVERVVKRGFTVHVIETTAGRTLFGEYVSGRKVNLERALRAADRLGGHIVQGHVDGVAVVERADRRGDAWVYDLRVPRDVRDSSVPQGSITLDGVGLTINALPGPDLVQVALIPFTRRRTTLGNLRVSDRVHVEGDVLGKYVRHLCHNTP